MKTLFICAALLLTAGAASAQCSTGLEVEVLPLTIEHHYDLTSQKIGALSQGVGWFGFTSVRKAIYIEGCTVRVGYGDGRLFVASQLLTNECAFKHVLNHELEHVHIYQQGLDTLKARIEALPPVPDLRTAIRDLMNSVQPLHALHDSPEEYGLNLSECDGMIAKLAKKPTFFN